uniref:Uncharacterized protein n=1 Tax=Anguilla anguilla TaxID=7936 RepID=A0A0E9RYZ8_ANGAN
MFVSFLNFTLKCIQAF